MYHTKQNLKKLHRIDIGENTQVIETPEGSLMMPGFHGECTSLQSNY
jgi:hypothetical protein